MPMRSTIAVALALVLGQSFASAWPSLDSVAFVKDRPATRADVAAGSAAFTIESTGIRGTPLRIQIPQYAVWHDSTSHSDIPVIVIQAEARGALSFVGFRRVKDNGLGVALLKEFTLLGADTSKLPNI
jgi:hypothetical protein